MSRAENDPILNKVRSFVQLDVIHFKSNEDILEAGMWLFHLRQHINFIKEDFHDEGSEKENVLLERKATRLFHHGISVSDPQIPLIVLFRTFKLNQVEKEIVVLLMLSHFGKIREIRKMEDIQSYLNNGNISKTIAIGKAFIPDSRLLKHRIIIWDYSGEYYRFSKKYIAGLIRQKKGLVLGWQVKSYEELLDHLYPLVKELKARAEAIGISRQDQRDNDLSEHNEAIDQLMWELNYTLKLHPSWKLNIIMNSKFRSSEQFILIALIGKELKFFSSQDSLFTGAGLARAACLRPANYRDRINQLKQNRRLYKEGFIQVCGGVSDSLVMEDPETLQACEFELTETFMKALNIQRICKMGEGVRKPIISFDQLVFSEKIKTAIELCLVQVKNHSKLFDDWQIGQTMGYGTGVTMLFAGPPGTGKTACAEAIAHQLKKPIVTVNYSQIQNCWVGQTEKNIVRTFHQAAESDAVLFWDEADAMFYDRDSASRNWEVRDVNVLLQELERFKGVCILSTNRKSFLDKALERRISIKIEFERPDKQMRLRIWQKLMPPQMPLDKHVSFEELSCFDLTGGEIKNIILNAARLALQKNRIPPVVCREDFLDAIKLEREGGWIGNHQTFGFHKATE